MGIQELFFIGLALSLDAFGVILCIGINKRVTLRSCLIFVVSFGFFQFFLSFLGGYTGIIFNKYIVPIPKIVGGIIIIIVGIFMISEGFTKKEQNIFLNKSIYFILGVSVSIDALVIGFTSLSCISNLFYLFMGSLFIGLITGTVCSLGVILSKYIKKISIISSYADYIGGVILILFGLKMLFF
ncbi:manganese efflux pump [Clostridium sp. Marseille-Q2269]|uniref:manganese efflux pump MntP n=1 Tax=Clostridium sp. Marseille-Q2269 TaxID=2942205 RepID=UPI00207443CF|nr:manganese efflux pump [Clostridium sp. Marseille-Q2269]